MMRVSQRLVSVPTEQGEVQIPVRSVLWIGSSGNRKDSYCCIHTENAVIQSVDYFEKVLRVMGESFLYCLDRGAVNMHRVVRMEGNECLLDTGERLPLTPFLAPRIKEAWCRYMCRRVWEN